MFLLVPAHPGRPGQRAVKRLCVCVCVLQEVKLSVVVVQIFYLLCSYGVPLASTFLMKHVKYVFFWFIIYGLLMLLLYIYILRSS